jgi:hypothetical protein
MIWLLAHTLSPLLPLSYQSFRVSSVELTDGKGGGFRTETNHPTSRGLAFYKSFITLWIFVLYERTNMKTVISQRPLDIEPILLFKKSTLASSFRWTLKQKKKSGWDGGKLEWEKRWKWIKRSDGDGWLWLVRWEELAFLVLHFLR